SDPMSADDRFGRLSTMAERLESSDRQHIHVDGIESRGFDGITPVANVRILLDGDATDAFPARQYALIRLSGTVGEGRRRWYVSDVVFPYEAESRSNVVESAHGHDH